MKKEDIKNLFIITAVSLATSVVIILFYVLFPPSNLELHMPHGTNEVIERNYDGPIYIVIAQTLYNPQQIKFLNFNHLAPSYYANHFPLFPILVRLLSEITNNYFHSAIVITWASTILFTFVFYLMLKKYKLSQHPLKLALLSLVLPPRWLAVHTVPGTEPLFSLLVILSFYFWTEKKYFIASLFVVLLTLTRPPGILFVLCFLAIIIYEFIHSTDKIAYFWQTIKSKWGLLLSPVALVGLFYFFQLNFGSFFAYFNTGTGTNVHLKPFPFAFVVGYNTPLSEGFLYLSLIYAIGVYLLWQQKQQKLALFCLVYLIPNFFMFVDDIYRYLIPISAFILIPYQKLFEHKLFTYLFPFFLLGIYLYTFSLLSLRMFPYDDYARLRIFSSSGR